MYQNKLHFFIDIMPSFIDTMPTFKVVYGKNGYYWNDAVREEFFKRTGTRITSNEGERDEISNPSAFRRNPILLAILEENMELAGHDKWGHQMIAIASIPVMFEPFCKIDVSDMRFYTERIEIDFMWATSSCVRVIDDFKDEFNERMGR